MTKARRKDAPRPIFAKSVRVFAIFSTKAQKRAIMQPSEHPKTDKYAMEA